MAKRVSVVGAYANIGSSEYEYEDEEEQLQQQNQRLQQLKSNDYISSGKVHLSKDLETSKKIINSLDDSIKQELISSFDCEADYQLQKDIAAYFGSRTGINNHELNGTININGKTIQVTSKKSEVAVDFYNETNGMNHGAIDIFTFTDPSTGAEIKIADANGNGVIETEELFFNELLTDINTEIMNTNNNPQEGLQQPDISDFFKDDNDNTSKEAESISKQEIDEIRLERIEELYREILEDNPNINPYEARLQAENQAENEILNTYSQQLNGNYTRIVA
ncbi:MAG TPA: hypothetical protein H9673_09010 [Candidatus Adamsella sp.]|nr:hypothetical protein [Candidatus Adamsella sp.]